MQLHYRSVWLFLSLILYSLWSVLALSFVGSKSASWLSRLAPVFFPPSPLPFPCWPTSPLLSFFPPGWFACYSQLLICLLKSLHEWAACMSCTVCGRKRKLNQGFPFPSAPNPTIHRSLVLHNHACLACVSFMWCVVVQSVVLGPGNFRFKSLHSQEPYWVVRGQSQTLSLAYLTGLKEELIKGVVR